MFENHTNSMTGEQQLLCIACLLVFAILVLVVGIPEWIAFPSVLAALIVGRYAFLKFKETKQARQTSENLS